MLLEREDVNKVYILIRPRGKSKKKASNANDIDSSKFSVKERFEDLKINPCLASDACQKAFSVGRVIPVAGDLNAANLGLCMDDYERMTSTTWINEVDSSSSSTSYISKDDSSSSSTSCISKDDAVTHIINLAADVGFEQTLTSALTRNVDTTMNVFDFVKDCKYLVNFVHCSTAYVAPTYGKERDVNGVKEVLHDLSNHFNDNGGNVETIYNMIKRGITKSEEDNLLRETGHNNTYCFSKYLAEMMLAEKCKDAFPLTIVRPSIVSVSLNYPSPGWTDNHNALNGPIYLYGAGFLHTRIGQAGSLYDVVPCDFVADRLISAAFTKDIDAMNKQVKVIHATAGKVNSIEDSYLWDQMEDFWNTGRHKQTSLRPFRRSDFLDMGKSIHMDQRRLQRIKVLHLMIGKKRIANKLEKIIPLLQKVIRVLNPFLYYRYDFQSSYSIQDFDSKFNSKDYTNLICRGVHYYLLKRSKKSPNNPKPVYMLKKSTQLETEEVIQELTFCELSFMVGKGKNKKKILNGISHTIKSGSMVAILGPSGAGKTTLMNILTMNAHHGTAFGEIKMNGTPLSRVEFEKHCCYVQQHDTNRAHLTVHETLLYAAKLFNDNSNCDISRTVNKMIESMGLNSVWNSRCYSLSGGQQRRVSLAIALLKKPSILFLDEFTSGLDSASADNICKTLRNVTTERKMIVVCTIHQPSTKVFDRFDQIMLLSQGFLAYAGERDMAEDYFSNLGHPLPEHTNPAEHYLELINVDFGGIEMVETIINKWKDEYISTVGKNTNDFPRMDKKEHKFQINPIMDEENQAVIDLSIPMAELKSTSLLCNEFKITFLRQLVLFYRDPMLYAGRALVFLALNSIFSVVYWNARASDQAQIINKLWLVTWFAAGPTMSELFQRYSYYLSKSQDTYHLTIIVVGAVAVYRLHQELMNLQAEVKNGMLKPSGYILANFCITLPSLILFSLCALCIPMFGLQTFDTSQMFPAFIHWSLLFYVFESLAETLAIWLGNSLLGCLVYLTYWIISFLFAGTFIRPEDFFWPFKLFYYTMPFGYYIRNMAHLTLRESSFEPCDPATMPLSPICVPSGLGNDVMEQLEQILPVVKNQDLVRDAMVLVGIMIVFKSLYIVGVYYKCTRSSLLRLSDDKAKIKAAQTSKEMNWMKTISVHASLYVEPSTVDEIQRIVQNEEMFPFPIRPAGRILSPSSISSNEGGTTISTANLTSIYGVKKVTIPCSMDSPTISCIDCEPGVTLRELQLYAHRNGLEVPFSAEIGSATVGGTCFSVTKDSSIGKHPVEGMGLGDMASMLWSVQVVEDDGELMEYCIFDKNGSYDQHFQRLLDSYGGACIAVRMMIVTRPKTPVTTIIDVSHFDWRNVEVCNESSQQIYQDWLDTKSKDGNIFFSISFESNMILLERRLVGKSMFAPLSVALSKYYNWQKKRVIQNGSDYPFILKILSNNLLKGSVFTRFHQQSRSPGYHYKMDIPVETPKLSFTNIAFPIENFQEVVTGMLRFTHQYELTHSYKPKMVAVYFVKLSGQRVAGPYSIKSSHVFFFDPTTNNPNDAQFMHYLTEFNNIAKSLGGKPSLNQTLCLEADPAFGATAISLQPSRRFESEWLKQFSSNMNKANV